MIESVGDIAKIQKLKLPDLKQRVIDAKLECDNFIGGINDWEFPVAFSKQKAVYLQKISVFETALKDIARHTAGVSKTHEVKHCGSIEGKTELAG